MSSEVDPQVPSGRRTRGSRRRQEILDAFTNLVAEVGYERAHLSDVATELGISKGTIVHHFDNKLTMLEEQHARYMHRRMTELDILLPEVESCSEQLIALIHCFLLCHCEDRAATRVFTREFVRFDTEETMEALRRLRHDYFNRVVSVIASGIERGEFRATDPRIAALQVAGACNWAWTWLKPDGAISVDEIAAMFSATFVRGLSAEPPDDQRLTSLCRRLAALARAAMAESERQC